VGAKLNLIREEQGIKEALQKIKQLESQAEKFRAENEKELVKLMSLKNMLLTAKMIAQASLEREESRGVFFRSDYPQTDPSWQRSIVLKMR
jgi:succinate dehydrogenase/fumarate reductase flavoprotein subunit